MISFFKNNKQSNKQFTLNKKLIFDELKKCNSNIASLNTERLKNFNINNVLHSIDIAVYESFDKIINYYCNIISSNVSMNDFQKYNNLLSSELGAIYNNIYKLIYHTITFNPSFTVIDNVGTSLSYCEDLKKIVSSNIRDVEEFQKKINEIVVTSPSIIFTNTKDSLPEFIKKINNDVTVNKAKVNKNIQRNEVYKQYADHIRYDNTENDRVVYQKSEQNIYSNNGNGIFTASYESGANGVKKENIRISGAIKNNKIVDSVIEDNTLGNNIEITTKKYIIDNKLKK